MIQILARSTSKSLLLGLVISRQKRGMNHFGICLRYFQRLHFVCVIKRNGKENFPGWAPPNELFSTPRNLVRPLITRAKSLSPMLCVSSFRYQKYISFQRGEADYIVPVWANKMQVMQTRSPLIFSSLFFFGVSFKARPICGEIHSSVPSRLPNNAGIHLFFVFFSVFAGVLFVLDKCLLLLYQEPASAPMLML